jgi:hypothetical protein
MLVSRCGQEPVTRGIVPDDLHLTTSSGPGAALATGRRHFLMLAYLDAGSASLIVQAIVAGAAGAAVFLKLGWRRITSPFRRRTATAEIGDQRDER